MKKKLNLNALTVNSFITSLDDNAAKTAKGGGTSGWVGTCAVNCCIKEQTTCDASRVAGTCAGSCSATCGINTPGGNETVGVGVGVGIATNPGG